MKNKYFIKYLAEKQFFASDGRQLLNERSTSNQIEKTAIIHLTKAELDNMGTVASIISATTQDKVLAILDMNKL